MNWHNELRCDSCSFKRNRVNQTTWSEADEHEQGTADHWVQLVMIESQPLPKTLEE